MFAHGPMPADAVLRIGLQVVRALAAAAFHGLTHRGIQPSNMVIVPGQTADGGWPFIKLLNFGLAGSEIYSTGAETRELVPATGPQFASPEQLLNLPLDFRSEMYSLGATMCFLLTGAIPIAVSGMKARLRARRLPELRRAPRALHNLLTHMLRENPDNRPQDPVAFEAEIRECLTKVERRQAIGRRFGLPFAAVIPRKAKTTRPSSTPLAQVFRGAIAFVGLMLAAILLGAFLLPEDAIPFWRHDTAANKIGVPVGVPVPDSSSAMVKNTSAPPLVASASPAPVSANGTAQNSPAPVVGPDVSSSPEMQQAQVSSSPAAAPPIASPSTNSPPQIASSARASEPAPPAEGPDGEPASSQNPEEQKQASAQTNLEPSTAAAANQSDVNENKPAESASTAASSSSSGKAKTAIAKSTRTSTSKRGRIAQSPPNEDDQPHLRRGSVRAQFVGMTPDGRVILRLPSGRIVTSSARSEDEPSPRRRVRVERHEPEAPVPYQPFDPDYPFGN